MDKERTFSEKADKLKLEYKEWKQERVNQPGWFPIFTDIKENQILKDLSGNALRVYLYLGIHSKNDTGISWHSIKTIADYFGKSERTISNWLDELKKHGLIERMQPDRNSPAITFLRPYKKQED
jgi:DNA-binding transcriptional ArsR family regulator